RPAVGHRRASPASAFKLLEHLPVRNICFQEDAATDGKAGIFVEMGCLSLGVQENFLHAFLSRLVLGGSEQGGADVLIAESLKHGKAADLSGWQQADTAHWSIVRADGKKVHRIGILIVPFKRFGN